FFQAEDGIRDLTVTGVQTCALPIYSGMVSCLVMRSRSVVPPMPSEVSSDSFAAGRNSMPSSAKGPSSLGSLMRMLRRMPRLKKSDEIVAGAAHVAGADGKNGVAGPSLLQQKVGSLLK